MFAKCFVYRRFAGQFSAAILLATALGTTTAAPGFTEPYRVVDIAAPELGIVSKVHVDVGDTIAAGDLLFELDTRSLQAARKIAEARSKSQGELEAARARLTLREAQMQRLTQALAAGHAQPDEITRARGDLDVAAAEQRASRERLDIARLEVQRIDIEIERRQVRAPLAGTVIRKNREAGEGVTPSDQVVMTLAILDPLKVRLNVRPSELSGVRAGTTLAGTCGERAVVANVERLAPIIDAQSGTQEVELIVTNEAGALASGLSCDIGLANAPIADRRAPAE